MQKEISIKKIPGTFLISMVAVLLSWLAQMFLTRTLGAKIFGDYIFVLTIITFLSIVCIFGMETATLRFLPVFRKMEDWKSYKRFIEMSSWLTVTLSVIVSFTCIILIKEYSSISSGTLHRVLIVGAMLLPIVVLIQLNVARIQSLNKPVLAQIPQGAIRPLIFIITIYTIFNLNDFNVTAETAMACNLISAIVVLVITMAIVEIYSPVFRKSNILSYRFPREWITTGLYMAGIAVTYQVLNRTDVVMIGALTNTKEAGIYAVGVHVSGFTIFGLTVINTILAPKISAYISEGNYKLLQYEVGLFARIGFGITLFLSILVLMLGSYILDWFGEGFSGAYYAMAILVFGQIVNAYAGSVGFLMNMSGNHKIFAIVLGLSGLLNVALNFLLIPLYGKEGAAISTTVTMVLWNIVLVYYVNKKLGIVSTAFWRGRVWRH